MSRYVTTEQLELIAKSTQPKTKPSSARVALIEQAGEARVDGRQTLGDVITGMLALVLFGLAGLSAGLAAAIIAWDLLYLRYGVATGLVIGAVLVALRAGADILIGTARDAGVDDPGDTVQVPGEPHGFEVWLASPSGKNYRRGILLEHLPERQVHAMLRRAAKAYLIEGQKFSKRGAGVAFGDHYSEALAEFVRLGILSPEGKKPNAGYAPTEQGDKWLKSIL